MHSTTFNASETTSFFLWLFNSLIHFIHSAKYHSTDVFSIWVTGGYFSPIGPRPQGSSSYLEEDAIPDLDAKPRKASEIWSDFFALAPLVDYGFDRLGF